MTSPPPMVVEQVFGRPLRFWGLFEDRFGRVRRQFTGRMDGAWDGQAVTMPEVLDFDDGAQERRTWIIRPAGAGLYRATADTILGEAEGRVEGPAITWRYRMALPVGGSAWIVDFVDWMSLLPDGSLVNRAQVSRWGIRIGSAFSVLRPEGG